MNDSVRIEGSDLGDDAGLFTFPEINPDVGVVFNYELDEWGYIESFVDSPETLKDLDIRSVDIRIVELLMDCFYQFMDRMEKEMEKENNDGEEWKDGNKDEDDDLPF